MKATTLKKAALAAGSLSLLSGSAFSQSAVSGAGGYETLTINAGKFNVIGLRLHEPQVVSGTFDSQTATSLSDADVNFSDVLSAGKRYLVEITGGTGTSSEGTVIEVDGWTGNYLTGLSDIVADDATDYTIRAAKTIGDVFGAANEVGLTGSDNADPSEASVIYVPNPNSVPPEPPFIRVFYSNPGNMLPEDFEGWLDADDFADATNLPLNYVDGIYIEEKGDDDLRLVVSGMVKVTSTILPVSEVFTYLGTAYPVGSTLGNSGLENSVTGSATATALEADIVYLPKADASGFEQYFYSTLNAPPEFPVGWYSLNFDRADDVELTSGMIIERRGSQNVFNAPVDPPTFYSDL